MATFVIYDGTGNLIKIDDWNRTTSISMDLLDRITSVTEVFATTSFSDCDTDDLRWGTKHLSR